MIPGDDVLPSGVGALFVASTVLLWRTQTPTAAALKRFEAFCRSRPALSLEIAFTSGTDQPQGRAIYRRLKPGTQRLSVLASNGAYEFRQDASGSIEIDHRMKRYYEIAREERFDPRQSRLSDLGAYAYPYAYAEGALTGLAEGTPFKSDGSEPVSGVATDHVFSELDQPGMFRRVDGWIASDGRLLKYGYTLRARQISFSTVHEYTRVEATAPTDPAEYRPRPPDGYTPQFLPSPAQPIAVGANAPFGKWISMRGRATNVAALARGKPALLLFTTPDCVPTERATPTLMLMAARIKAARGIALQVMLSGFAPPGRPAAITGFQGFLDRSGSIEKQYGVPGTPMLFLVDSKGRVSRAWLGFPLNGQRARLAELESALRPVSKRPRR